MNLSFTMLVFSLHYYKTYIMCYFYREKRWGCSSSRLGQGRSQDFSKGGSHCVKRYRHGFRKFVGCLLKKRLTKGGVTGTPGPPSLRPCRGVNLRFWSRLGC